MQETHAVSATRTAEQTDTTTAVLPKRLVVIGASVGGPLALAQILPKIPEYFPGTLIVAQQMRRGFTRLLAEMLASSSDLIVREAENHNPLYPGLALVAPGGAACAINYNSSRSQYPLTIGVDNSPEMADKSLGIIDILMKSAAESFGDKVIGVMLTGIGNDGREGMRAIKEHKGYTIAQDESTCTLGDTPRMIADLGLANDILPLWAIPNRILELVGK